MCVTVFMAEKEVKEVKVRRHLLDTIEQKDRSLIEKFDQVQKANGLALRSRVMYMQGLRSLSKFSSKPMKDMEKDDLIKWIANLNLSKNTINLYKIAVKKFFTWLYEEEGKEDLGIINWIRLARLKNHLVKDELLSPEDIQAMVGVCKTQRDRALLSTLYESACRAGEILGLRCKDVKFDKYGSIFIVDGKTGARRIRLIDSAPDLQLWINQKRLKGKDDPLWEKEDGTALRQAGLYKMLTVAARRAGIKKKIYPHLLRHSKLTELSKVMKEQVLKAYAGWTGDSRMAATYVHLSGSDIDREVLLAHGIEEVKEEKKKEKLRLEPRKCPRCGTLNPVDFNYCSNCSMILDATIAMEMKGVTDKTDEKIAQILQTPEVHDLILRLLKKELNESIHSR